MADGVHVARVEACVAAGALDALTGEAAARQGVAFEQLLPKPLAQFAAARKPGEADEHVQLRFDAAQKRRRAAVELIARELKRMSVAVQAMALAVAPANASAATPDAPVAAHAGAPAAAPAAAAAATALGAPAAAAEAPAADGALADARSPAAARMPSAADGAPSAAGMRLQRAVAAARPPSALTPAEASAMIVIQRARAAKAAAATQRYRQQTDLARAKQEETQRARERAQAEEARRIAEKEAAEEAERQRRFDEAKRREAVRRAEAERREHELAERAARVAAELDAGMSKHVQTAEERRRAEAEAYARKGAEKAAKIDRAKQHVVSTLSAKWQKGEALKRDYDAKLSTHERAVRAFVKAHQTRRLERSARAASGSEDVTTETARKLDAIVSRLSTAEQRANAMKAERERLAADAAAGKSDAEQARRDKLAAAERVFGEKLNAMLRAQEEADRRRAAAEGANAKEVADARLRAELRAAEVAERVEMRARQQEYANAQATAKIVAEDAKRAEQLALTAFLADDRRRAQSDDGRNGRSRSTSLRTPGPSDVDNRFFAIGRPSHATTGARPKRNGPAYSIGIRKQVLAAPLSETPGPKYLPSSSLLDSAPAFSIAHRYAPPSSRDATDTPGPMDYSPSISSLERTKMRRAPAAVFDAPSGAIGRRAHGLPESGVGALEFADSRLPGPSDYDISKWRTDSSPSFSFGGQGVRTKKSVAKLADVSPGPASYGFASDRMLSKGLSF
ncbi:hypothetical protein KFE25_007971 [Diacronema lutheri]|uniref:Uncharacterized protein n=1 Tax=Diacronema lutheri TaxID=2081491 RepID=A0A8J5XQM0_DIALT|nr:hypothetical protein KFE25_007971 [Diacronema lutheri]